ncbi:unnamed protein product [Thelazia callipaeda]|uniref:Pentatricopeptide repeat-containing protein n=1 Tax=Thelazia callipaeda TaxID=103827 RepID=A0A0N5D8D1_THECL|nr:unnamed protein product [Thelazia callipaeda]
MRRNGIKQDDRKGDETKMSIKTRGRVKWTTDRRKVTGHVPIDDDESDGDGGGVIARITATDCCFRALPLMQSCSLERISLLNKAMIQPLLLLSLSVPSLMAPPIKQRARFVVVRESSSALLSLPQCAVLPAPLLSPSTSLLSSSSTNQRDERGEAGVRIIKQAALLDSSSVVPSAITNLHACLAYFKFARFHFMAKYKKCVPIIITAHHHITAHHITAHHITAHHITAHLIISYHNAPAACRNVYLLAQFDWQVLISGKTLRNPLEVPKFIHAICIDHLYGVFDAIKYSLVSSEREMERNTKIVYSYSTSFGKEKEKELVLLTHYIFGAISTSTPLSDNLYPF